MAADSLGVNTLGSISYNNLWSGNVCDVVPGVETLLSGQVVTRGTVLGMITASGKLQIADSTKSDGSQTIYAIAAEACDATGGDKPINVYYTGEFNTAALTFGGTDTAAKQKVAARNIGIFFGSNVTVGGIN